MTPTNLQLPGVNTFVMVERYHTTKVPVEVNEHDGKLTITGKQDHPPITVEFVVAPVDKEEDYRGAYKIVFLEDGITHTGKVSVVRASMDFAVRPDEFHKDPNWVLIRA